MIEKQNIIKNQIIGLKKLNYLKIDLEDIPLNEWLEVTGLIYLFKAYDGVYLEVNHIYSKTDYLFYTYNEFKDYIKELKRVKDF